MFPEPLHNIFLLFTHELETKQDSHAPPIPKSPSLPSPLPPTSLSHTKKNPEISLPNYLLPWASISVPDAVSEPNQRMQQQQLSTSKSTCTFTVSPEQKLEALDPYQTLDAKLQVSCSVTSFAARSSILQHLVRFKDISFIISVTLPDIHTHISYVCTLLVRTRRTPTS